MIEMYLAAISLSIAVTAFLLVLKPAERKIYVSEIQVTPVNNKNLLSHISQIRRKVR